MDENEFNLTKGNSLPNEDSVYRIVHQNRLSKRDNLNPRLDAFIPNERDEGKLSVDYSKKTSPEMSIARFGATYKFNQQVFKNQDEFHVYELEIFKLKSFSFIEDVVYDPIMNENPIEGLPNNNAHSLVIFNRSSNEDEPEVLSKLHDYAKTRKINVDRNKVNQLTIELRK